MTMGKLHDIEGFKIMHQLKMQAIEKFGFEESQFILSMGTSADFEDAVKFFNNNINIDS